jgi:hypothetical protein
VYEKLLARDIPAVRGLFDTNGGRHAKAGRPIENRVSKFSKKMPDARCYIEMLDEKGAGQAIV